MTRRGLYASVLALSALLAGGCIFTTGPGDNTLAGGTIETTNGIVVMPDGRPAARIKVFLLDEKSWLSNVKDGKAIALDSSETDENGVFKIDRDTSSKVSLMANAEGHGILIRHVTADLIKKEYWGKIMLRKHVSYRGTVGAGQSGAKQVYLAGTPFSALIDPDGGFSLPNIPPEKYPVVVRRLDINDQEEYVTAGEVDLLKKDSVIPTDTLKPDTSKTLLLEDFEQGNNYNELGAIFAGIGYWDAYSDEYLGGNSRLLQPTNAAPQNFSAAIGDGGAQGRERSLEVLYQSGSRGNEWKPFPFVYLSTNLGPSADANNIHVNLSKMDTVTFYAKGSGRLVVEFGQKQIGVPLKITAGSTVTLTDTWQLFKLPAKDFSVEVKEFPANPAQFQALLQSAKLPTYAAKPQTWEEMGGRAHTVTFLGTEGTSFWLDEIRFHGLVLDDLVK